MKANLNSLSITSKTAFFWAFFLTLMIKLAVSALLPVTCDEATYWVWGRNLSAGYYDHPPLIGWLLHPLTLVSHAALCVRLPVVITTSLIGFLIYSLLKNQDEKRASLIAILYLISPINLFGMFITNDCAVILFSFLSGCALFYAIKKGDHWGYFFLAGVGLGLAFLAKYFAVLLGLSYFIYFLTTPWNKKRVIGFGILFSVAILFGLQNLYWNYTHGWTNILFNVYNRNSDMGFQYGYTLFEYVAIVFYIATPPLFYYLIKHAKKLLAMLQSPDLRVMLFCFIVPLGIFLALSSVKEVGLHWPLAFVPFIYVAFYFVATTTELMNSLRVMVAFSGLHALIGGVLLWIPLTTWQQVIKDPKLYADLVFLFKYPALLEELKPYENEFVLATPNYATTNQLYFAGGKPVIMFGVGSINGRECDFLSDFRTLAHQNILLFYTAPFTPSDYQPYFARTETKTLDFNGATFYVVLGYDFNYLQYRDTVLAKIHREFWHIPDYLPHTPDPFYVKYWG